MSQSCANEELKETDSGTEGPSAPSADNVNLIKRSDSEHDIKEKLEAMKQLADRYEKQLFEERSYRQDLEKSFEKRSRELEESTLKHAEDKFNLEQRFLEMEKSFDLQLKQISSKCDDLASKISRQQEAFDKLSDRYQRLAGQYEKTASQMRDERITLPQTVNELQFECLRLREALIESRASKEHVDAEHASEIEILSTQLSQMQSLYQPTHRKSDQRSPNATELLQIVNDLEKRLVESQEEHAAMARSLEEYRQKCIQLQQELNTSEGVQKDFVQLSQKLQVQLEMIRQGDQELRWQFPNDVRYCNGCNADLKQKINCKHCCKIFCLKCLEHTISVGSNKAQVCQVCNTLLSKNSAPFFSSK